MRTTEPQRLASPDDPQRTAFYREAIEAMGAANIPFLIGGAFALKHHTGIKRDTKDLDIFVLPADCPRALDLFSSRGFQTELTAEHWLGKVWGPEVSLVDVIFGSGNGLCVVDEPWFDNAARDSLFDTPVLVCPPEEMIWSKGFIMERDRFDGADIAHLIRALGPSLDWARLLRRFDDHWHVLLTHLLLFNFSYPNERAAVPASVMRHLLARAESEVESAPSSAKVCRGTLLSREQYQPDICDWDYQDARLPPWGNLTPQKIRQ
jgi:hypothetical protein